MESDQEPSSARAEVRLIGGFDLKIGDQAIVLPAAAQRVVALVALESRPMSRSKVAGRLWTDSSEERALANLRTTLWRIRNCGAPILVTSQTHLRLSPSLWVDLVDVVDAAKRLWRSDPNSDDVDLDADVFTGELLPDWYDNWVIMERERLRQLCLHALEKIAGLLSLNERYGEAIDAALLAIRLEPFRESAHRTLIDVHMREGNPVEALRVFGDYRETLLRELGVEPSSQMDAHMHAVHN